MKKMRLKKSIKEKLQTVAILGTLYLIIFVGIVSISNRNQQLEQQQIADTFTTNINSK